MAIYTSTSGNDSLGGTIDEVDTASYVNATSGVQLNLTIQGAPQDTIGAGTDTLSSIENLTGSAFNDMLTGDDGDNTMLGGAGDDVITAGGGNNFIDAGAGNDVIHAVLGNNYMLGGTGTDTLSYATSGNFVVIDVSHYSADVRSGGGYVHSDIDQIENFIGSVYGDGIYGDNFSNVIMGGQGNDILSGGNGAGVDTVSYAGAFGAAGGVSVDLSVQGYQAAGGAGQDHVTGFENVIGSDYDDALTGSAGNNVMEGGSGNDYLIGNGGIDTVSYANAAQGMTISINPGINYAYDTNGFGTIESDSITGFTHVIGSNHDDEIIGSSGDNILIGGMGNDILSGLNGLDTASYATSSYAVTLTLAIQGNGTLQNTGGAGTDTLIGIENLTGSAYNDVLTGNDGDNVIDGGDSGRDILSGGLGTDMLIGGLGSDTADYAYGTGDVTVSLAITGAQTVATGDVDTLSGIETVIGSSHNDTLTGNAVLNTLYGMDGDDVINGGAGNDTLDGGTGVDMVDYSGGGAVRVSLGLTSRQYTGAAQGLDSLVNFENITGSAFNDTLTGTTGENLLNGGNGDDVLDGGGGGFDSFNGGIGNDTATFANTTYGIYANLGTTADFANGVPVSFSSIENIIGSAHGDTILDSGGNNKLFGGAGADTIYITGGTSSADGGTDIDRITFDNAGAGVTFTLNSTAQQNTGIGQLTARGFENVTGTAYDDVLTGSGLDNVMSGGFGDDLIDGGARNDTLSGDDGMDRLFGASGDDYLSGGTGNDVLNGGTGNDMLIGGDGIDTADYASSTSKVTVTLMNMDAQNTGSQGTDTLYAIENLTGGSNGDTLGGNGGNNVIIGMLGKDVMTGNGGNDRFVYNGIADSATLATADRITDLSTGDIVDLSGVVAGGVDDAFHQVGSLTGVAGEFTLAYDVFSNTTTFSGETNGAAGVDMMILFTGDVTGMTGSWML